MPFIKKPGQAIFRDRYITKANELFSEWNEEKHIDIGLIGVPLSKSSISHSGASMAPTSIRKAFSSFSTFSIESERELNDRRIYDFGDVYMHPTDIITSQSRIKDAIAFSLKKAEANLWIILGGDHSISFPSIQAFQEKFGEIGVIQFDAHHDLRNLDDGGPTNGTPFRSLIESNTLKGNHLVQIGIRDFANGKEYYRYGKENGVTIYSMKDVREKGIKQIIQDSINMLLTRVQTIYVSLDMDVVDQAFAPGCPAIGPGGMTSDMLLDAMRTLSQYDCIKALDVVEIDPFVDIRDMTSKLAAYSILTFLNGMKF